MSREVLHLICHGRNVKKVPSEEEETRKNGGVRFHIFPGEYNGKSVAQRKKRPQDKPNRKTFYATVELICYQVCMYVCMYVLFRSSIFNNDNQEQLVPWKFVFYI